MAKTKVPPRKIIKARGTLPVPRIAPKRSITVWYKRRGIVVIGGILALGLLVGAVLITRNIIDNINTKKDNGRAVGLFDRKVKLLQQPFQQVLGDMNKAPQEFAAGKLSAEEYKKAAVAWVEEFRKLDFGLRERKIPANMPGLEQARAHFVQGTVLYIDAAKMFHLSADLTDPILRDDAIKQGNNMIAHATSVYGLGQRKLISLKKQFGLKGADEEAKVLGPIPLPEEEVTPPPPPGLEEALQDAGADLTQQPPPDQNPPPSP